MAQGQDRHARPHAALAENNHLTILGDLVEMFWGEEFVQRDLQTVRQGKAKDGGLGWGADIEARYRLPLPEPFQQGFRLNAVQGLTRPSSGGGREKTEIGFGQPMIEIPGCKRLSCQ
jgi:hypothetical protein